MRNTRALVLVFVLALAGSIVVTLAEGTPNHLPGVALGSSVLLHIERGAAMFLGFVAGAVILIRSARGDLPTELGTRGLRYAEDAGAAVRYATEKVDALSREMDTQRTDQAQATEVIQRLETDVAELRSDRGER